MKKLLLMAAMMAGLSAFAQNPIVKGLFSADPTARIFNGKIYVYPSHDIPAPDDYPRKDWFCMADYHVFSTEDMINYTDHGMILHQDNVEWVEPKSYSMWAPDCIEKDGKYYFFFPANVKGGRGFGIGVAVADSPTGPFVPREKNIEGINGIDPCVLQGYDGKWYIYWGGVSAAEIKPDFSALADDTPKTEMKFGDRTFMRVGVDVASTLPPGQKEGPFAFKRNGKYYLTYPWVRGKKGEMNPWGQPWENPTEVLAYAMSDNPLGPFEYKGIIMKEHANSCWTNHHSIIEKDGQWYLFYHHNDYSPEFDKNRSICCDSLFFNEDGTIQEVLPTFRGVGVTQAKSEIQIDRYTSISGATIAQMDPKKPFDGWKTVFAKAGDSVKYNTVNFAKEKDIVVRVKNAKGAVASVYADDVRIAYIDFENKADWTEQDFDLDKKVKGVHHITVKLEKGSMEVDWIKFK